MQEWRRHRGRGGMKILTRLAKSFDPWWVEEANERYMIIPWEGVITFDNCLAHHVTIACGYEILRTKFLWHNSLNKALRENIKFLFASKYFLFNLCRKFYSGMLITFHKYKMGITEFVLRYEQLKTKYRVFLQGFPVSMVTCYVTIMTASSSAIIAGIITLLLGDTVF